MKTLKARGVLQLLLCHSTLGSCSAVCSPVQPLHCLQAPSPKTQIWPCSSPTPVAALCPDQDQVPYSAIPGPWWPCLHLFLILYFEAMPNFWWSASCLSFTPMLFLLLWLLFMLSSLPLCLAGSSSSFKHLLSYHLLQEAFCRSSYYEFNVFCTCSLPLVPWAYPYHSSWCHLILSVVMSSTAHPTAPWG